MLDRCRVDERWATTEEQQVLARWASWGALPEAFDEGNERFVERRERLRNLLGGDEAWAHARRTTINAHYTSAEVVQQMWQAAEAFGFSGGRVLEPGCGSGNFLGFAPEGAEMVGVELDETTAAIAEHLYGARARVHAGGFEDFNRPEASFDLVVGNVPFAKVTPHDPLFNRGGHTLHNYFLLKSIRLTRPGGLVMALTSRYTLDARANAARREMARYADLVGAVRLPKKAFSASSGTAVVVDLLVLRRRQPGATPEGPAWVDTVTPDVGDLDGEAEKALITGSGRAPIVINQYLADHPNRVLGRLTVDRGMYTRHELTVEPTGDVAEQLSTALDGLVAEAAERGATLSPPPPRSPGARRVLSGTFNTTYAQEGSLVLAEKGVTAGIVGHLVNGEIVAYRPRKPREFWELRRLIKVRDAARHVLAVQLRNGDDTELEAAQGELRKCYDTYVKFYGRLNRFRMVKTASRDAETGEPVMRRDFPAMGGFRRLDPDWPLVAALEVFDEESQTAEPAPIFSERIVEPPEREQRVETAADAISVCLDESGMVLTERVAELLGITEERARAEMGDLVFDDPETSALVPASQYLSGNVRKKLDVARAYAADNPRWQANVEALERALPRSLEPEEIKARLGASWIPASDIEAFCREVLDAEIEVAHAVEVGRWHVKARSSTQTVALRSEWGTEAAGADKLLEASLNQRLHTVYTTKGDKRVKSDKGTLAARDKQEALNERFGTWLWEDPDRARRLADAYNRLFRSHALTRHDGRHLSLPGLSSTFTPMPHQRDAVARILTDGRALLAHTVGAGKTATMVMAAMEMRRLGSAAKPAVVVPNHMLEQFSREWLQLYPTARILVADATQLDKARRAQFVARCALGDWDGIIFTHAGFGKIPLGRELLGKYLKREAEAARAALSRAKLSSTADVKKLEALVRQSEETSKKLLAAHKKDDGIRFEETGIDYVMVDSCRHRGYAEPSVGREVSTLVPPGFGSECWWLRSA